jgi:nitroimidazol reductase NimA-like FMN-containing flavoprotein (pyridoxamine 5'-phosphate oxidase superfamily)
MRRKDKEISELEQIEEVMDQATVCFLALCDGFQPYVVPLSFGRVRGCLYFHAALQGRKIDLIRGNPRVGFALEAGHSLLPADKPCEWSLRYRSVVGRGRAVILSDPAEKRFGLECIAAHYGAAVQGLDVGRLDGTCVIRVDIEEMTGKRSG